MPSSSCKKSRTELIALTLSLIGTGGRSSSNDLSSDFWPAIRASTIWSSLRLSWTTCRSSWGSKSISDYYCTASAPKISLAFAMAVRHSDISKASGESSSWLDLKSVAFQQFLTVSTVAEFRSVWIRRNAISCEILKCCRWSRSLYLFAS